ncbi:MAG: hypothetical protein RDU30_07415 [Desulfovibrionaceae bacterium]|nr:hypothetical protein [Desulfovibrionaceae bacterium]
MSRNFFAGILGVVGVLCSSPGFSGERIEMTVTPVTVFLDQGSRAFCAEMRSVPGDRMFVTCDDATGKKVMEELFALGKRGEACTVVGEVVGRSGDVDRLVISEIRPAAKGSP